MLIGEVGGARPGWGWPGSVIGTPRGGMVGRRTATLMYAGQNRRSAPRRKVPLTKVAPAWPSQRAHGDRSCSDGAPAWCAAGGHRADPRPAGPPAHDHRFPVHLLLPRGGPWPGPWLLRPGPATGVQPRLRDRELAAEAVRPRRAPRPVDPGHWPDHRLGGTVKNPPPSAVLGLVGARDADAPPWAYGQIAKASSSIATTNRRCTGSSTTSSNRPRRR